MEISGSVTQMIDQLRSDDPRERDEAARLVWEHYFRDLLALAHRHLGWRIRQRVDAEDLLQSMYASVCRRQQRGDFELYGRDDFWKLFVTITLNKARNAAKRHLRARARRGSARSPSRAIEGPDEGQACVPRPPVPPLTRPLPWPKSWRNGSARSPIRC